MQSTPSILPPLFLIAGLISFAIGFWASESLYKKNTAYCQTLCPAESIQLKDACWCGTGNPS